MKRFTLLNYRVQYVIILILAILLFVLPFVSAQNYSVHEGDIVFQVLESSQSKAVQLATKSKYSHVGMILFKHGKPYVFEAVGPVKYTSLNDWIEQGNNGHYVIKRLKKADSLLTPAILEKMHTLAASFEGKRYDFLFNWNDEKLYCSELVWKIYNRAIGINVGRLQHLKDFDLTSPIVKQKLEERYGDDVPFEETVVSPQAIFESDLLETIKVTN